VVDETQLADTFTNEQGRTSSAEPGGALLGRTLGGRYHVFGFVGAGGMGEVYRAHDRELDEIVAVKTLRPELASRPALVERFRKEVRLARRVTHPSVARVFELHTADGTRFVTMEYVEGEPLSDVLAREGRLPWGLVARIGAEVGRALEAAHAAGVIHRDIKPDNVMLRPNGHIAVADFGIAFSSDDTTTDLVGTPAYMSPEQVRNERTGPRTDVYALGVTLFELVTGTLPFEGETAAATMIARLGVPPPDPRLRTPEIPVALARIVTQAMAERAEDRHADASVLASALEDLASSLAEQARFSVRPRDLALDPAPTVALVPFAEAGPEASVVLGALREELLLGITRVEGVRLHMDEHAARPSTYAIGGRTISAGKRLVLEIRSSEFDEVVLSGRFPLDPKSIPALADFVLDGLALSVPSRRRPREDTELPAGAIEPWLRARRVFRRTFAMDNGESLKLYEQALAYAPDHPVLLAGHAMALVRFAFFSMAAPGDLDAPRKEVERALSLAPTRPEPHIAAGHLALHGEDPVSAARHFRAAVRAAPGWPDGHEWLGRMLLEAGFLDDARARLEAAMLREPELYSVRWELARAEALEGRWDEARRQLDLLERSDGQKFGRGFGMLRLASWNGDPNWIRAVADELEQQLVTGVFDPVLCRATLAAVRGDWELARPVCLAKGLIEPHASLRRRVFYAQVLCDLASANGDLDLALQALERAVTSGLFDVHWLERSPSLQALRADARSGPFRAVLRERAARIHDALYGG
jgi:serine/threonine-protein kinase